MSCFCFRANKHKLEKDVAMMADFLDVWGITEGLSDPGGVHFSPKVPEKGAIVFLQFGFLLSDLELCPVSLLSL